MAAVVPPIASIHAEKPIARNVALVRQLNFTLCAAGVGITGLMLFGVWGRWLVVAVLVGSVSIAVTFNSLINFLFLVRWGRSVEVARSAFNAFLFILIDRVSGWPLAGWLWLPFTALAFDHLDPEVAIGSLIGTCVSLDAVAIYDGVPWIYPVCFTALAAFSSEMSRRRFSIIRDMLLDSDAQRLELVQAYVSLGHAHQELTDETEARVRAEMGLRQAQKLEAVGRLASGVAHEINTPIQFVSDSVAFMRDAFGDLREMVTSYRALAQAAASNADMQSAVATIATTETNLDVPFVLEELPKALDRSLEGLNRIASIVRAMKEFAHPDQKEKTVIDLNRAISSVLEMARSEYKYVAEVETTFGDLPPVLCHPGELNQALLNVIVNAAHAVGAVVKGSGERGRISIHTHAEGSDVIISISDTGCGIPENIREQIFDPFFTTKEVGQGTGQGLAIARGVVVDKHGGTLTVDSHVGIGTTFVIRIPIAGSAQPQREAA